MNWLRVGRVEFVDTLDLRSDGRPVQYAQHGETLSAESGSGLCNMIDASSGAPAKGAQNSGLSTSAVPAVPEQPVNSTSPLDLARLIESIPK